MAARLSLSKPYDGPICMVCAEDTHTYTYICYNMKYFYSWHCHFFPAIMNCFWFKMFIIFLIIYFLFSYLFIWPPLCSTSSYQSSWLQIWRYGFDSQCYQIFWEAVGLEWGPLSLMSIIEELLGKNSSSSGLENRDLSHWPRDTLYQQKLAQTSLTNSGLSVGIVRSQTKAMELFLLVFLLLLLLLLLLFVHLFFNFIVKRQME
jgi:hypothetical protein